MYDVECSCICHVFVVELNPPIWLSQTSLFESNAIWMPWSEVHYTQKRKKKLQGLYLFAKNEEGEITRTWEQLHWHVRCGTQLPVTAVEVQFGTLGSWMRHWDRRTTCSHHPPTNFPKVRTSTNPQTYATCQTHIDIFRFFIFYLDIVFVNSEGH